MDLFILLNAHLHFTMRQNIFLSKLLIRVRKIFLRWVFQKGLTSRRGNGKVKLVPWMGKMVKIHNKRQVVCVEIPGSPVNRCTTKYGNRCFGAQARRLHAEPPGVCCADL